MENTTIVFVSKLGMLMCKLVLQFQNWKKTKYINVVNVVHQEAGLGP